MTGAKPMLIACAASPALPAVMEVNAALHVAALKAIPEPPSLTDLRKRVEAMLPQVDLAEVILEMMSWEPGFTRPSRSTLTSVPGRSRRRPRGRQYPAAGSQQLAGISARPGRNRSTTSALVARFTVSLQQAQPLVLRWNQQDKISRNRRLS